MFWSNCPGNGKTDVCKVKAKKNKGEKASKAPTMKENWNKLTKKLEEKMKNGVNTDISKDLHNALLADGALACIHL